MSSQQSDSLEAGTSDLMDGSLWTISEAARFLKRFRRWVETALKRGDTEPGSIPHRRLPGKRGEPRFIPAEMAAWSQDGFPPVATFREWHDYRKSDQQPKKNLMCQRHEVGSHENGRGR